jgi:hypothetical protein
MTLERKIQLAWKYRKAVRIYLRLRKHRQALAMAAGVVTGVMLVRGSTRPAANT